MCYTQGVVVGHASSAAQITYLIVESHNSSATCPGSKSSALHRVGCPRTSGKATHRQQVSAFPLGTLYGGGRRSVLPKTSFAPDGERPSLLRCETRYRRSSKRGSCRLEGHVRLDRSPLPFADESRHSLRCPAREDGNKVSSRMAVAKVRLCDGRETHRVGRLDHSSAMSGESAIRIRAGLCRRKIACFECIGVRTGSIDVREGGGDQLVERNSILEKLEGGRIRGQAFLLRLTFSAKHKGMKTRKLGWAVRAHPFTLLDCTSRAHPIDRSSRPKYMNTSSAASTWLARRLEMRPRMVSEML